MGNALAAPTRSPAGLAALVVVAWLLAATIYCHTYGLVDQSQDQPDWAFSIGWTLRHWGLWLALGPLLAWAMATSARLSQRIVFAVIAVILATVGAMIFDAIAGYQDPSLAVALYGYLPQASAVLLLVIAAETIRAVRTRGP